MHAQFKRLTLAPILFCLVFLSACIPTSENPITSQDSIPPDDRLLGAWKGYFGDDDEAAFLHIVDFGDETQAAYRAVMIGYDEDTPQDGGIARFDITTAKIDDNTFMNARWLTDDDKPVEDEMVGFYLVRYIMMDDKSLTLRWISEEKFQSAVEEGSLRGESTGSGFMQSLRVTATSEELTAFIRSQSVDDLFDETIGAFTRIH